MKPKFKPRRMWAHYSYSLEDKYPPFSPTKLPHFDAPFLLLDASPEAVAELRERIAATLSRFASSKEFAPFFNHCHYKEADAILAKVFGLKAK